MIVRVNNSKAGAVWPPGCLTFQSFYQKMNQADKENYMKAIIGEAEYEANLYDWKEEGRAEGAAEKSREVARKMKAEGITDEVITKCTGLTIEEVEVL